MRTYTRNQDGMDIDFVRLNRKEMESDLKEAIKDWHWAKV